MQSSTMFLRYRILPSMLPSIDKPTIRENLCRLLQCTDQSLSFYIHSNDWNGRLVCIDVLFLLQQVLQCPFVALLESSQVASLHLEAPLKEISFPPIFSATSSEKPKRKRIHSWNSITELPTDVQPNENEDFEKAEGENPEEDSREVQPVIVNAERSKIKKVVEQATNELGNLYGILANQHYIHFTLLGKMPYQGKYFQVLLCRTVSKKQGALRLFIPAWSKGSVASFLFTITDEAIVLSKAQIIPKANEMKLGALLIQKLIEERHKIGKLIRVPENFITPNDDLPYSFDQLSKVLNEELAPTAIPPALMVPEDRLSSLIEDPHQVGLRYNRLDVQQLIKEILTLYRIIAVAEKKVFLIKKIKDRHFVVMIFRINGYTTIEIYSPSYGFSLLGFAKLTINEFKVILLEDINIMAHAAEWHVYHLLLKLIRSESVNRQKPLQISKKAKLTVGEKTFSGNDLHGRILAIADGIEV